MFIINEPIITDTNEPSYTKISFQPDFTKFKTEDTELSDDFIALMKKRTFDIAGCNNNIKVYFNDELIKINNFK